MKMKDIKLYCKSSNCIFIVMLLYDDEKIFFKIVFSDVIRHKKNVSVKKHFLQEKEELWNALHW